MEKRFHWKLKQREIILGERTQLMGILNITPDSFSDGGLYNDPDKAWLGLWNLRSRARIFWTLAQNRPSQVRNAFPRRKSCGACFRC